MLGFETSDDAAVYKLSDDLSAVLTADFFTPMIDDPYDFGRIAGANALSDVFAMGARPLIALNLLSLSPSLGVEVAQDILKGGADAVAEAGALIGGGHTIDDDEPKYGLSVFGTVHPSEVICNKGAESSDLLYLTKPLGTGIMTAAVGAGEESFESIAPVVDSMKELNAKAAEAMIAAKAHAATDVTGFGLAGHLHEMLKSSGCSANLSWSNIPLFSGVWEYSKRYCRPNKAFSIMDFGEGFVAQGELSNEEFDNRMGVLCDPQTSGGLLIAIAPSNQQTFEDAYFGLTGKAATCIGAITPGDAGVIRFAN